MRIYLHREGRSEAEAVEAPPAARLVELLEQPDEDCLFLLEDDDNELKPELTLAEAKVEDRSHLFVGKIAKLAVEVQFNGTAKSREFAASTKVERVRRWAVGKEGFDLDRTDAAEHTLSVAQTGEIPPSDVLIGSLPRDRPGHLLLNLVPKHRFEG
jgi:hypothetical protein